MSSLTKLILDKAKEVYKDLSVKDHFECKITNFWININSPGSSNAIHVHPKAIISGVFYISTPKDSGDFFLENTNYAAAYILDLFTNQDSKDTYSHVLYNTQPGDLLLFPAWIPHGVGINNSKEDRVSIAFNIGI